jgi:multicomponent Na+:H+ antiporter subunit E
MPGLYHTSGRKGRPLSPPGDAGSAPVRPKRSSTGFVLTFVLMFATWLVFSGRFDAFHLVLGIISCGIVAFLSGDLLFSVQPDRQLPFVWLRFAGYIPWLLYQIFLANLHVMYLVLHPRMRDLIDPQIIEFDSKLSSDVARATFANSITLTPGTITVHVTAAGKFSVHCIDAESGKPLPGKMEARIAKIFGE